jgi:hypothetical protein
MKSFELVKAIYLTSSSKTNVVFKIIKFSELLSLSGSQVMIANSRSKEEIQSFGIGSSF